MNKFQARQKARELALLSKNENDTLEKVKELENHYFEKLTKEKRHIFFKRNKKVDLDREQDV